MCSSRISLGSSWNLIVWFVMKRDHLALSWGLSPGAYMQFTWSRDNLNFDNPKWASHKTSSYVIRMKNVLFCSEKVHEITNYSNKVFHEEGSISGGKASNLDCSSSIRGAMVDWSRDWRLGSRICCWSWMNALAQPSMASLAVTRSPE